MRLGRRLTSGIAEDPPVAAESEAPVTLEARTEQRDRVEVRREYAEYAAER